MTEKHMKAYPTIRLVINPKEARKTDNPVELKGGLDFRLIEDRGLEVVELDPRDARIEDWRIRHKKDMPPDGTLIGQALVHLPNYHERSTNFAVEVVSGGLPTKEEYAMRENLLSRIGDPTLGLRATIGATVKGIRDLTATSDVTISLNMQTPLTVDGGSIYYYYTSEGRLYRRTIATGGDSNIVKSILGSSEALNIEPNPQDEKIVGKDRKNMCIFPLNILSRGGQTNIIGCIQLLNDDGKDVSETDINTVKAVSGPIAVEILKKQMLVEDPISGARDKRNFESRTREHIISNLESPESLVFAISDLDRFKDHIVSPFGHVSAGSVIRQYVSLARKILGDDGVIGAYGGDEFTFVMWDGITSGMERLEGIREAVEKHSFTVTLPKEKKDLIVVGNHIGLLKVREGRNRIVVTEDTHMQETEDKILIGLPPGTLTTTIGVSNMVEAHDLEDDPTKIYLTLLERSLDRLNTSKHRDRRNRTIYDGP